MSYWLARNALTLHTNGVVFGEQPYLALNIQMTRHAYRLDTVDVKPFEGVGELTPASLEQDQDETRFREAHEAYQALMQMEQRRPRRIEIMRARGPSGHVGTTHVEPCAS